MDLPSPALRDLAKKLLAACPPAAASPAQQAALVNERLRISLARLCGVDGVASLMWRALTLAKAEAPALSSVQVSADGRLEGLDLLSTSPDSAQPDSTQPDSAHEASAALTAHLLGLLVTFIGESLTLRLLREAWPELSPDE